MKYILLIIAFLTTSLFANSYECAKDIKIVGYSKITETNEYIVFHDYANENLAGIYQEHNGKIFFYPKKLGKCKVNKNIKNIYSKNMREDGFESPSYQCYNKRFKSGSSRFKYFDYSNNNYIFSKIEKNKLIQDIFIKYENNCTVSIKEEDFNRNKINDRKIL